PAPAGADKSGGVYGMAGEATVLLGDARALCGQVDRCAEPCARRSCCAGRCARVDDGDRSGGHGMEQAVDLGLGWPAFGVKGRGVLEEGDEVVYLVGSEPE